MNGSSCKAVGSVQAGVPVLLELNGSVFRQPVPLGGHLLFFKAATSTELLLSITGKGGFTFCTYSIAFNEMEKLAILGILK